MATQELFQHTEICWTIIIIILNFIMARRAIPIIAFPRVLTIYIYIYNIIDIYIYISIVVSTCASMRCIRS